MTSGKGSSERAKVLVLVEKSDRAIYVGICDGGCD